MLYFFIQEIAIRRGLNYAQLQEKVDIDPFLLKSYWFNKTEDVSLSDLRKIAQALGVQAGSLLIETDAPPPPRNASGKTVLDIIVSGKGGRLTYQSSEGTVTASIIGNYVKDARNFIRVRTSDGAEHFIDPANVISVTTREFLTGEETSYNFYEEYEENSQDTIGEQA